MSLAVEIFLFGLVAAILAPLILLLVYTLADRFGLPFADRLLTAAFGALLIEWGIAAAVNIAGGAAIMILGLWGLVHFPDWHRLLAIPVMLYGLWRLWKGAMIAIGFRDTPAEEPKPADRA